MRKWKNLGSERCWEAVAERLTWWPCRWGRSSVLCKQGAPELGRMKAASPLVLLHFLDCTGCAQGCSVRGTLFTICTYTGTDHRCFSSGVQRSCVPGPEEGVCRYRLQLQAVSAQSVGRKQLHISRPFLKLSHCWQSLVFHDHPPTVGFSLSYV